MAEEQAGVVGITPSPTPSTSESSLSDRSSVLSMVVPTTYSAFSANTCCLAAERALKHLETVLPEIEKLFSSFQIHNYRIFAGFDEGLIQAEIGFLEQIHVFLSSDPAEICSLLPRLSTLFTPFSAIVFTKTSQHRIPNDIIQPYAFINNLTRKTFAYPTAISLSQSPGTGENTNTFHGPSGISNGQGSGGVNKGKEREEEISADRHGDRDGEHRNGPGDGDGDGDGDENNRAEENRAADREGRVADRDGDGDGDQGPESWKAEIHFSVISKLLSSLEMTSDPSSFQSLQTKGKLTIMRTAEQPAKSDGYGFAACHIQFNELVTKNRLISEKPVYGHFHTTVIIDSLQKTATIDHINPLLTPQYQKDVKVASSSKRSWTLSASALIGAILLKPQLSFTGSAGQTSESGNNIERVMNFDRITQIDMEGIISWGFYITDRHEQESGRATPIDKLPSARFEFVGDDDNPVPPPKLIDVEVSTYFSLLPHSGSKNILGNIWESPNQILYSNFCQITALRIPLDLRGSHNYHAQLLVYPRPVNKTVTSTVTVDTQVERDIKFINVNPLIVDSKRNFGGNGIDNLLKDSTLELTAFRRVRKPVNKLSSNEAPSTAKVQVVNKSITEFKNPGPLIVDSAHDSKRNFAEKVGIDKDSTLKPPHVQAPAKAWIRPRSHSMSVTC